MMIRENTESDMRGSPPSRWSGGRLVLDVTLVLSVCTSVMLTMFSVFPFGSPRHAGHVNRFMNIITMGSGNILSLIFFFVLKFYENCPCVVCHNLANHLTNSPLLYKCFLPVPPPPFSLIYSCAQQPPDSGNNLLTFLLVLLAFA